MAIYCHNTPGLPDQTRLILPRAKRDELHDDIVLALDAIGGYAPIPDGASECAGYLHHALRIIGGVA